MLVEGNIVFRCVIGSVEVVRVGGELGSERVDPFYKGRDTKRFSVRTNSGLGGINKSSDVKVSETHALGAGHKLFVDSIHRACISQSAMGVDDIFKLVQEPLQSKVNERSPEDDCAEPTLSIFVRS